MLLEPVAVRIRSAATKACARPPHSTVPCLPAQPGAAMERSWDPTDLVHPGSNYDQSQARRHSRTARPAQAFSSDRGRLHSTGHGRRPCHHPAAGQHQQRLALGKRPRPRRTAVVRRTLPAGIGQFDRLRHRYQLRRPTHHREAAQGTRRESPLGAHRADRALPDPPSHSGTDTRH